MYKCPSKNRGLVDSRCVGSRLLSWLTVFRARYQGGKFYDCPIRSWVLPTRDRDRDSEPLTLTCPHVWVLYIESIHTNINLQSMVLFVVVNADYWGYIPGQKYYIYSGLLYIVCFATLVSSSCSSILYILCYMLRYLNTHCRI